MSSPGDCLCYLINPCLEDDTKQEDLILIDAGSEHPERIVENIESLGLDSTKLKHQIITHGHIDHTGNSAWFKKKFNMIVYAHELEKASIEKGGPQTGADFYGIQYEPVIIDHVFSKEIEQITIQDLKMNILHIPGHTPGGIAPYMDYKNTRIIFSQDTHGPLMPLFGSDRKIFVKSLKKMLDLKSDILCEGHFGVYEGKNKVANYIQQYIHQFSRW